jgi:succinate-acetate transporter protein
VAFFSLFFTLDMAFLLLGIGYLHRDAKGMPNPPIIKAGGFFALLAAFLAWYNALAGIADDSNRYVALAALTPSSPLSHSLTLL